MAKYKLGVDWDASCCIQNEIGYFKDDDHSSYSSYLTEGDTEEEVAQKMVSTIIDRVQSEGWEADGVQIRFLWFKDPVDYKGEHSGKYEFSHLRDAVMKHEYAKHVGTWVNGNTGNKMDGWMLIIPVEGCDNDF